MESQPFHTSPIPASFTASTKLNNWMSAKESWKQNSKWLFVIFLAQLTYWHKTQHSWGIFQGGTMYLLHCSLFTKTDSIHYISSLHFLPWMFGLCSIVPPNNMHFSIVSQNLWGTHCYKVLLAKRVYIFWWSWSNFMWGITGGGERQHNVLRQIGSKLWCPWQQKSPIDL